MSKALILAEKPSVGRDIARVLKCSKKSNSHFESNQYIVTWALGHLVTLATPDKYDKRYENWSIDNLPIIPNQFKLEIIGKTSKQFYAVKKQMLRQDVSTIIIATDAGREGELVARWIIEKAYVKKPLKRLWISSVTDKAIREGFQKLKNGNAYDNLYQAAVARAEADWIVGLNATRALTCKYNASLSCGRVQTPTLNLVSKREAAIREFKPKNYYEINVKLQNCTFKWHNDEKNETRLYHKEQAEAIQKACQNKQGIIKALTKTKKKSYAKGLYDLTELQRDANQRFGFSAKETLGIMQKLYETHKILTYPRTDSKYLTEDIVPTLKERLKSCQVGSYKQIIGSILKQPIKGNASFVNNQKVGDHHAIIPTEQPVFLDDLSQKEFKIYDLVIKRFLSVLLPPYEYEQCKVTVDIAGNTFNANFNKTINVGFKILNANEESENATAKEFIKGESYTDYEVKIVELKTSPPSYLTEGELLGQMEKGGLGTVATRGDIIEKIYDNNYVEKTGQHLKVTKKGKQLLQLVPEDMRSAKLTASWENSLEKIAKGQLKSKGFLQEMKAYTKKTVQEIKQSEETYKHDNLSHEKCPQCGKNLLNVHNKFGKKLVCQDRSCGYSKNLSKTTNARCPECHKKLELVGEGDNKRFICKCGYREKLSAFNQRKNEKNKNMSKKEVQKYMKKNAKKEEAFNNPFAQLLVDMDKEK